MLSAPLIISSTKTLALGLLLSIGAQAESDIKAKANAIAQSTLIVDTHIDVPYRLTDTWDTVTDATEGGDFDYVRALKGGLNAPFMSIYTPARMNAEEAKVHADKMIAIVERMVAEGDGKFVIARNPTEVRKAFKEGIIALPMGMENGSPIGTDLALLDEYFERGIRYITLAHSLPNSIADSSYAIDRPNAGLSAFGEKVVTRMNALGIMVDISHVSDDAFYDVMALTDVPAIASHSSARFFTPGFERNMNDDMIKLLDQKGGVIMINYGSSFLTATANQHNRQEGGDYPYASLEDVLDHIDHVVKIASINAVGIGSDYDGVGDSLPIGLKDVASYPNLVEGLLKRGYSEADIRKILSGNLMRVWDAVEKAAGR